VSFIGFVFDPLSGMTNAATRWGFLTRMDSVSTYTDTGVTFNAGTWYDLSFIWNRVAGVYNTYFRVNQAGGTVGAKQGPITTNIPDDTQGPNLVMFVANGPSGTTSTTWAVDMWEIASTASTATAFRGSHLIKNF
jgi:hypothetical protein